MSKLVAFYLFLLLFLANLDFPGSNILNQSILWGISPLLAVYIFVKRFGRLRTLPSEFFLYGAMLIVALPGILVSQDLDGFFRYYRVIFTNTILMIILFLAIRNMLDLKRILYSVFISCFMVIVGSILFAEESSGMQEEFYRLRGMMGNANGTAIVSRIGMMVIVLISVLKMFPKPRLVRLCIWMSFLFLYFTIIITASRANFGFATLMFPALIVNSPRIKRAQKISIFIFLGLVVIFFVGPIMSDFYIFDRFVDDSGEVIEITEEKRFTYIRLAVITFLENPVIGIGLNQFRYISGGKISHTDLLDIATQIGFLGLLTYGGMYFKLFMRIKTNLKIKLKKIRSLNLWLMLFLSCEFFFGFFGTNWFFQYHMVFFSILVSIAVFIRRKPQQVNHQIA